MHSRPAPVGLPPDSGATMLARFVPTERRHGWRPPRRGRCVPRMKFRITPRYVVPPRCIVMIRLVVARGSGPPTFSVRRELPTRDTSVGPTKNMKAIVQHGYGSPDVLELRDIDRPAVADDTVLVRIRAASINAFDWGLLRRLVHVIAWLIGKSVPRIRGGDMAGVVEACGRNVSRFKPGDEVFGIARGTFAEYATTTEARLALKPRRPTLEQRAALPAAGCPARQGLRRQA